MSLLSRNSFAEHPVRMLWMGVLCFMFIMLAPATASATSNTVLKWKSEIPSKICPEDAGRTIEVCAELLQKCGRHDHEPLAGRELLFFINPGNCGVNVGQNADDSVLTDEFGRACATLTLPTTPGKYSIRVKFRGEAKPDPCPEEGNSACYEESKTGGNGKKCVQLSNANLCKKFYVDPDVCCEPIELQGPPDTTVALCVLPQKICIGPWDTACGDDDEDHEHDGGKSGEHGDSDHECDRREHDHDGDGDCDEEHDDDDCEVETSLGYFTDGRVCFEADTAGTYTIIICAGNEDDDHDDHDGGKSGEHGDDEGDDDCNRWDHDHDHDGDCDERNKHCDRFACDTVLVHVRLNRDCPDECDLINRYLVKSIAGGQAPPNYCLRLDGFFTGNANDEVTFSCDDVLFDEYADGTARFYGVVSVAEFNGGAPGIYSSTWNINVYFNRIPDATAQSVVNSYNPSYRYYMIAPDRSTEMVNQADASDIVELWTYPGVHKPFQVGVGANEKNNHLGAAGWINYKHNDNGAIIGGRDRHFAASDFLMDLVPPLSCPNDTTIACADGRICIPGFECYWPICEVSIGTLLGDTLCFLPTGASSYEIALIGSDTCGNADTCWMVVTVEDDGPPRITGVGPDTTLECPARLEFSDPSAWDDCDPDPVIRHVDSTFPGNCEGNYSVKRTWVVIDAAGNRTTKSQTITIVDTTPPVISGIGRDKTANCPSEPSFDSAWADDRCDPAPVLRHVDSTFPGRCDQAYTIQRTWVATDDCGNTKTATQTITVVDTLPPICFVPRDTTIFLCAPGTDVCLPVAADDACTRAVACRIASGPGTLDDGLWCFTPTEPGTVTVYVICTDACGNSCDASFNVTFEFNQPPVCEPRYPSPPLCAPALLFVPFSSSDPDGGPTECTLYGPGELVNGGWQYAPTPGELVVARIVCVDVCGDSCVIPIEIQVPSTQPPFCNLPDDQKIFRCSPGADSLPVSAGGAECRLIDSPGLLRNGWWVYESQSDETVDVTVECTTPCDTCSGTFRVAFEHGNEPECRLPDDTTVFRCYPGLDSLPYFAPDDATCLLVESPGLLRGGWWVYDVQSDEVVTATIRCSNECGSCEKTFRVTYDVNERPICLVPNDTSIFLGTGPREVRLPVSATDADGNFAGCEIEEGPGVIENGYWVYTPQGAEEVCVTVSCWDRCEAYCEATFCVRFTLNQPPECRLLLNPSPPLCAPTLLVVPFESVDPEGGPVSCELVGPGELFDHTWQYLPLPGEQVSALIVCKDTLGDSCVLSIELSIPSPQPPICELPSDTAIFLCETGLDSLPVFAAGASCRLIDSPGLLRNGWWVYDVQQDEVVDVTVECVTLCDTCSGSFVVVYDVNEPPVCLVPNDTTIFQVSPGEIRLPVTASDQDENFTYCDLADGPGVVSNGYWIYTPTGEETVCVTIVCYDACGDSCLSTFCVTIELNQPPDCSLLSSTEVGPCTPSVVRLDYASVDPEGGPVTCTLVGPGELFDHTWRYEPTAGESVNATIICKDEHGDSCIIPIAMTFPDPEPPHCELPNDTTITICGPTQVSIPVPAAQSEDCSVIAGPGELLNGAWVYSATNGGVFDVTVQCVGTCETCEGTFRVTINNNEPPRIDFVGLDKEVRQCEPEEVCMPIEYFDSDGLEDLTVTLLSGPGTINEVTHAVCFTPTTSGNFRFIVQVTDPCGETDLDSVTMQVTLSGPPSCELPPNHRIILCEPSEICFPIANADQTALGVVCEIIDGVGEIRGNNWCYFVDSPQSVEVMIRCTDECGNTCQISRTYTVEIDPKDCDGLALRAGDLDRSGYLDVVDVTRLARLIFGASSRNQPSAAGAQRGPSVADVNCDGAVNMSDLTRLADYVFGEGEPPCLLRGVFPAPAGAGNENPPAKSGASSHAGGKRR